MREAAFGIRNADALQHLCRPAALLRPGDRPADAGCRPSGAPMVSTGLWVCIGSWKTIAMASPRSARISRGRRRQQVAFPEQDPARADAGIGRGQAQDRGDQGGLAAAGFADDADDPSLRDGQGDVAQGLQRPRARSRSRPRARVYRAAARSPLFPQLRIDDVAQRLAPKR